MRILVAMSGGVDSSVAAALLAREGHEVLGVTLQLWGKDVCVTAGTKLCCSVRDALDAKAVAKRLGIRHETLELVEEFRARVIDYFVDSYAQGLTPNPCIACNDHIKFGALLRYADGLGANAIATGHYARVRYDPVRGRSVLRCAFDLSKDQSYVLFGLTQAQLSRVRFPLGELSKPAVRELARELGLATADKPDSQDICFVRDRDKDGFLRRQLQIDETSGPITLSDGTVIGTHRGLLGYTIGQREGLGIALGYPIYVIGFDRPGNRLLVGTKEQLRQRTAWMEKVNWVSIDPPAGPRHAQVKIRSRHTPAQAGVAPVGDGRWSIVFEQPQEAVTPGQAAVLYDGDEVLGGGYLCASADVESVAVRETAAG